MMTAMSNEGLTDTQPFRPRGVPPQVLAHLPCVWILKSSLRLQNPGLTCVLRCPICHPNLRGKASVNGKLLCQVVTRTQGTESYRVQARVDVPGGRAVTPLRKLRTPLHQEAAHGPGARPFS